MQSHNYLFTDVFCIHLLLHNAILWLKFKLVFNYIQQRKLYHPLKTSIHFLCTAMLVFSNGLPYSSFYTKCSLSTAIIIFESTD